MSCTQKQQLVCFPKVRVYKPWFRHFNDHKDFRNEGTVHLFSLMALFNYANFRSNERVINGDRYMEAPGQWICKLGALPRILRVHSKAQALELMEYFQDHGFLTFEILDEEKEILRFTISDWKEHCTHLQYNYYSYKGSGFFFFPLPVGRLLLKIARKEVGIVFSELDAIMDMWLHTILNDPKVRGSEYMPVVYYSNTDVAPDTTLVIKETHAKDGYILDDTPQTVKVKSNEVVTVEFRNQPKGGVLVKKVDAATNEPISDVEFLVTDSDGNFIGNANGKFITDSAGTFTITDIAPGTTLIIKETRAKDGYLLDDTPQTVKVKSNEMITLEFRNQPLGGLRIIKLDSVTKKPLEGVQFRITYSDGSFVADEGGKLSSNGLYMTDANGEILIRDIVGTLVVTEVKTIPGYTIDEATRSQTIVVNPDDLQTLIVYNVPAGGLQIIKSDEDTGERLGGVKFEIRKINGEILGTYTTDRDGVISIPNAESGWYTIVERKAKDGYALDTTPVNACVKDSETTTVEITNQRMASIMIHKIDAATGADIYGVKFVLYDSGKNPIGEYTTDQDGYIYIDDELVPGKYYLRELEAADGYIRDEQYKTVYVERGKCAQIEWENSAVTGQIQIRKYSSEDNTVTGQLAGTPLEGAVFEITQARSGKVVGYIVTDARGVAASGPLPLGRYFVTEVSAPKYYQLSGEKMEAEIEYPSQIIKLSAYNKPASLGVTIKKSGNYEVQSGQTMSYDFSGIANTSNVALNHFFWHDRIPTDATRALSISTGTYNARLYYKVTFKTNLNDYRTLASNLLTSNNYSLSLNAATLRLAQGEYVTDVRFEFGTVPSGFSSVVKPTMRVQVLGTVSNGYQIINRADVGGQYLNEWQTAKTTWVTTVRRFNTTPLPKTGY